MINSPREASDILLGKSGGYDFGSKEDKREFVRQLNEYLIDCAETGLKSPSELQVKYDTLEASHKELQARHLNVMQSIDGWVQEKKQSNREPISGLYNRSYLEEALRHNVNSAKRYGRDMSLSLLQIRDYEMLTNLYGGAVTDKITVKLADIIRDNTRGADIPARLSRDQYVVVMPETSAKGGSIVAVRIISGFKKAMNDEAYTTHMVAVNASTVQLAENDDPERFIERALSARFGG